MLSTSLSGRFGLNKLRAICGILLLLLLLTEIELSFGGSTDKTSKKTYT
jgi:hypothetical protein